LKSLNNLRLGATGRQHHRDWQTAAAGRRRPPLITTSGEQDSQAAKPLTKARRLTLLAGFFSTYFCA
jgi:hypothetical protein